MKILRKIGKILDAPVIPLFAYIFSLVGSAVFLFLDKEVLAVFMLLCAADSKVSYAIAHFDERLSSSPEE